MVGFTGCIPGGKGPGALQAIVDALLRAAAGTGAWNREGDVMTMMAVARCRKVEGAALLEVGANVQSKVMLEVFDWGFDWRTRRAGTKECVYMCVQLEACRVLGLGSRRCFEKDFPRDALYGR